MRRDKSLLYNEMRICYSEQAEHFGHSRNKYWPELDYILDGIETRLRDKELQEEREIVWDKQEEKKKKYRVVELGCGAGRFASLLHENFPKQFRYRGVDNAPGMIAQAQATVTWKHTDRTCNDMLSHLAGLDIASVDVLVAIASVQHLMSPQERETFFAEAYRVLSYGGVMILTNWSYSDWFLKKYWSQQLTAGIKTLFTLGKWGWNDLLIPWKDPNYQNNKKVWQRYYHLFTLYELEQLARLSGFIAEKIGYVCQDGSFSTDNRRAARNSLVVVRKGLC